MKLTKTTILLGPLGIVISFQQRVPLIYRRPSLQILVNYAVDSSQEAETMKLRDIQAELRNMGVTYKDCFDRESLINRLKDARQGKVAVDNTASSGASASNKSTGATSTTTSSSSSSSSQQQLDATKILADLRSKTLKELKTECSQRSLRYGTFLEKEDFVQAIWKDMQKVANFSASGAIRPGIASDVTGEELDQEIMTTSTTPILVDVYATWCGPCKMMAPEMDKAAAELGAQCRVAKLDSDKHHQWAGKYKIQGLPTTLVIHKGQIKTRLEGAVMKDKLLDMVRPYLNQQ